MADKFILDVYRRLLCENISSGSAYCKMASSYNTRKRKEASLRSNDWICSICEYRAKNAKGLAVHFSSCRARKDLCLKKTRRSYTYTQRCKNHAKVSQSYNTRSQKGQTSVDLGDDSTLLSENHVGTFDGLSNINNNMTIEEADVQIKSKKEVIDSSTDEQLSLFKQEEDHAQKSKGMRNMWSVDDVAKVDLLHTLNKHGCPNGVFNDILRWSRHYSSRAGCTIFDSGTQFQRRDTFLNKLSEKRDMIGLRPTIKKLIISDGVSIDVTTFDFKQQLLSMLRDKELMKITNLVPFSHYTRESEHISEIQDGAWYKKAQQYYDNKYGTDGNRLICGTVLTIDKTHTDAKGKLCLEPVNFSLSIFNKITRRKMKSSWRTLGFVNDLDGNYFEEVWSQDEYFSAKTGKRKNLHSVKKSIIYHAILDLVLESLKEVQDEKGIIWDLPIGRDGNNITFNILFPLCFGIFDMKGGKQVCGMYDSSNSNRPCISCYAEKGLLDDTENQCKPVYEKDLKDLLYLSDSTFDYDKLQVVSQYPHSGNSFFKLENGGWPFGIWGMCPTEVLHQFYEGVVTYALTEFLEEHLTAGYRKNLERLLRFIVLSGNSQSDRSDYPMATFSLGFTNLGRMKGIEKHSLLFFLSIFLHTDIASTELFSGRKALSNNEKIKMKQWCKLFERSLYYHDWLMQYSFRPDSLDGAHCRIKEMYHMFQRLIKRKGLGIRTIPKFHEMLHVVRDIRRHGPAIMYDSCITEGHHHSQKQYAARTQKRIMQFSEQTGNRLYEDQIVDQTWEMLFKRNTINCSFKTKKKVSNGGINNDDIVCGGKFIAKFDAEKNEVLLSPPPTESSSKFPNLVSYMDYTEDLRKFLLNSLFSMLKNPADTKIKCFGSIVKNNITFKGLSRKKSVPPGWADIQWVDPRTKELSYVPAKILLFLDIKKVEFLPQYQDTYNQTELHVVIQSLTKSCTIDVESSVHQPICSPVLLEHGRFKYRIVSVDTIYDSCFLIPNYSGKKGEYDSRKYLYVYRRNFDKSRLSIKESGIGSEYGWNTRF